MIRRQTNWTHTLLFYLTLVVLFGSLPCPALGEEAPIYIEADNMSSVEKSNSVLFKGNVDARQGDVHIRSDEMTVHYTMKDKDGKKSDSATQQVEKLICLGNVEITRAEWLGTSHKMDYFAKKREVILSGNAKAYQGQNMVSGEKIKYYIDEGRSEVVGGTKTIMGDTGKTKKKPSRVNMTILQQ